MDEESPEYLPRAKISSTKSQSSDGRQQSPFASSTPSALSDVYSHGLQQPKKQPGRSPTSPGLGEKIRSSLPNIGNHLKRWMKFKSQRDVRNDRETSNTIVDSAMSSLNSINSTKIEQTAEEIDEDRTSEMQEFPNTSADLVEENPPDVAVDSVPSADSPSPYDSPTMVHSMESDLTMTSLFGQPVIATNHMTSSSVEANMDDLSERMTLANVVTDEGAIIAGDPLDLASALNAQLGYDRIRTYAELQARRDHEPRTIPLLYLREDSRRESYTGSSVSGGHGSSTSGSDDSIETAVPEVREVSTETSASGQRGRSGRDQAQQYYDAALRAALRKRFRHLDDEPPIY